MNNSTANNFGFKVFLCHASENKTSTTKANDKTAQVNVHDSDAKVAEDPEIAQMEKFQRESINSHLLDVRSLDDQLGKDFVETWLDEMEIKPGDDWEDKIEEGIKNCSVILICLSRQLLGKTGVVWSEIRLALKHAQEMPLGRNFIIPILLNDCDLNQVPKELRKYQICDLHEKRFKNDQKEKEEIGYIKLLNSLRIEAKKLNPQIIIHADKTSKDSYEQMIEINKKFSIDKFPVTNQRFVKFLTYLDNNGKHAKIIDYVLPAFMKISLFNFKIHPGYENYPVTGVTWIGAMAFAEYEGKILPTVDQWCEAFGPKSFPYGDFYDSNKCNTAENEKYETTPVDFYPNGISPFGVFDMAGNVWEWCWNRGKTENQRKIKGGAFSNRSEDAQRAFEAVFEAHRGGINIGFRCLRNIND